MSRLVTVSTGDVRVLDRVVELIRSQERHLDLTSLEFRELLVSLDDLIGRFYLAPESDTGRSS